MDSYVPAPPPGSSGPPDAASVLTCHAVEVPTDAEPEPEPVLVKYAYAPTAAKIATASTPTRTRTVLLERSFITTLPLLAEKTFDCGYAAIRPLSREAGETSSACEAVL